MRWDMEELQKEIKYEVEVKMNYCGNDFLADFHFDAGEETSMLMLNKLLLHNFNGKAVIKISPVLRCYTPQSDRYSDYQ